MVLGCDGGADKAESYSHTGRRGKRIQWKKKRKEKVYSDWDQAEPEKNMLKI